MKIKTGATLSSQSATEQVIEYHVKTKHYLDKYAAGPEFLDWDLQPNPYRYFTGIDRIALPLNLSGINSHFQSLYESPIEQRAIFPIKKETLAILLGLSMGLSAHKEYMGDRWSLRCNPSSGNLHPTEVYLITSEIDGLSNGIYHYLSEDHSLQQRMSPIDNKLSLDSPMALLSLTSIHWREAWKYGERAFRYCQLDIGHALAAMAYAARCLGWQVNILKQCSSNHIATVCGIDRKADFEKAEQESPELIISIELAQHKAPDINPIIKLEKLIEWAKAGQWHGKANVLDNHPMYRWPVIAQVDQATEITPIKTNKILQSDTPAPLAHDSTLLAKHVIYARRSAQRFDKQTGLSRNQFYSLLDKCLYRPDTLPWSALSEVFPMFCIFYVHRINSLTPGLYLFANTHLTIDQLKQQFNQNYLWSKPASCPEHLSFYLLSNVNAEKISKRLSCHQAIASDGAFSLSMFLQFEKTIIGQPMNYRKIHWQAGVLGQLLYLEAESIGLQGTGIGCFFDDAVHQVVGLSNMEYQVIYHFTVGAALNDARISTLPAYEHL